MSTTNAVAALQIRLLTDTAFRRRFAASPAAVLKEAGIAVPAGTALPASLPQAAVDLGALEAAVQLRKAGIEPDRIDTRDPKAQAAVAAALTRGIAVRAEDPGSPPVVVLICPTVTSVVSGPVVVASGAGAAAERARELGIERVERGAAGLSVHGPGGIRVDGLGVEEVANLIRRLR